MNRRRKDPTTTGTIIGGYTYWDDLVLHPRWVSRQSKFIGDWDSTGSNLVFGSGFRRAVGIREPVDDFDELRHELCRVFAGGEHPLADDPERGIAYHLGIFVPTLNCGVVAALGSPARSTVYFPPFGEALRPLDHMTKLCESPTLGRFGQLATEYADELADRYPGRKQARLTELDNFHRTQAFVGLGAFAAPMLARLRIPEPDHPAPPRRTSRIRTLLGHRNPYRIAYRGRTRRGDKS